MILDFRSGEKGHALRHDVLDARTGEKPRLPIFYADDAAGIVRHYIKADDGSYLRDEEGRPAWREVRMAIRIVPKPPAEVAEIDAMDRDRREGVRELRTIAAGLDYFRHTPEARR
jgi:hypothetical protein